MGDIVFGWPCSLFGGRGVDGYLESVFLGNRGIIFGRKYFPFEGRVVDGYRWFTFFEGREYRWESTIIIFLSKSHSLPLVILAFWGRVVDGSR